VVAAVVLNALHSVVRGDMLREVDAIEVITGELVVVGDRNLRDTSNKQL
jgi:predicted RNA-binding protein with EMAP domain